MKPVLSAKYLGLAYAATVALIALAAIGAVAASVRQMPITAPVRAPGALPEDTETMRIERAGGALKQLASLERSQRESPAEGSSQIVALHVPSLATAAQMTATAIDSSKLSMVIVQTGKGRVALVDGFVARVGEAMPGGETVREVGSTFVVIEDGNGVRRRIDIKDRFAVQATSTSAAPLAPFTPSLSLPRAGAAPTPPTLPLLPLPSSPIPTAPPLEKPASGVTKK